MKVADSLKLKLSSSVHQVLTWYANNTNDSNLVIDLMFLWLDSVKVDNFILSDSQYVVAITSRNDPVVCLLQQSSYLAI